MCRGVHEYGHFYVRVWCLTAELLQVTASLSCVGVCVHGCLGFVNAAGLTQTGCQQVTATGYKNRAYYL